MIGSRTRVKVVKNKVAPPFKQAEFDIIYGQGISRESCLIDLGTEYKVLNKSGTWYSYNDDRIGQGKENLREYLQNNPAIADEIEAKIRGLIYGETDDGKQQNTAAVDTKDSLT